MKQHILPALKLTLVCILFFSGVYTLVVWAAAQASPGQGKGLTVQFQGRTVGYANIGQSFTDDRYFQGRPSAVGYNAAGSGASNKGAADSAYLGTVQDRIDTFLAHNPGISKKDIPVELVTASGSGLDPDLSLKAAMVQVPRVARLRHLPEEKVAALVQSHCDKPFFGPARINVLQLNISLDRISTQP